MTTKRRLETNPAITILEPTFTEIVVAETGDLQPFLKTFRYAPENASQESLGTMLGVFEIGDRSETSAYIVNFLASVAKKEYFGQPRRGVTESLEATLHKINRALAELIKQGNTEWLGTLHATIGVIDKGTLHFSVTGGGSVVLIRNGFLSIISDGLAPEEAATHPLKTFIEISSGRLQQQDLLLLASPELFTIFTPDDLERATKHFPPEKLARFVHTALVNESPIGGVFVLSFKEITPVPKTRQAIIERTPVNRKELPISNVFSQSAFQRQQARAAAAQTSGPVNNALIPQAKPAEPTEYTDDATGHIYIQGETASLVSPDQQRLERVGALWQSVSEQFGPLRHDTWLFIRRSWVSFSHSSLLALQSVWRGIRHAGRSGITLLRRRLSGTPYPPQDVAAVRRSSVATMTNTLGNARPAPETKYAAIPSDSAVNDRSSAVFANFLTPVRHTLAGIVSISLQTSRSLSYFWQTRSTKQRMIIAGVLAGILLLGGGGLWSASRQSTPTPVVAPAPIVQAPTETNLISIASATLWQHPDLQAIYSWKNTSFIAVGKQEVSLFDTATDRADSYPLPDENATILQSAFLPDVQMLVLLTTTGSVISFTPANHAFSANNLHFDKPQNITALAGYSSYLYAFDASNKTLTRAPRADGGFGTAVSWFREAIPFTTVTSLAISTDLFLSDGQHLFTYTRGKQNTSVSFENSATPIAFDHITLNPNDSTVATLDAHFGRIILFDATGKIRHQYADPSLKQATGLDFDASATHLLLTTPDGLRSLEVK